MACLTLAVALLAAASAQPVQYASGPAGVAAEGGLATDGASAIGQVAVNIYKRGGRFVAYRTSLGESGDPNKVSISVETAQEVDSNGRAVGMATFIKHGLPSVGAQNFSIKKPPEDVFMGDARASKVSFNTSVGGAGQMRIENLIVTRPGMVGVEGDQWNAAVNDVKWNIVLSNWMWCGCVNDNTLESETGSFVDVYVSAMGSKAAPTVAWPGSNKTWDLGGGILLELTSKIIVDGRVTTMPAGFPRLQVQGGRQLFVFRFPKFASSAVYDPLVRMGWAYTGASSPQLASTVQSQTVAGGSVYLQASPLGGRVTTFVRNATDVNAVLVMVNGLREVDGRGYTVGSYGNVQHSVDSFTGQNFTVQAPRDVTIGTARAQRVSLNTTVASLGQLRMETYMVVAPGVVRPDDQWNASVGDVKLNIELSAWSWCGCQQPDGTPEQGAYVDLDLVIKGRKNATLYPSGRSTWDLGGGVTLELIGKTLVDGDTVDMAPGFPKLQQRGSATVFSLRFPKFRGYASYEALLRMSRSESVIIRQGNTQYQYINAGTGLRPWVAAQALALPAIALAAARAA